MPLDRAHVTTASRIMLPTYPAFAGGLGINFLIRGHDLTRAGVFYDVADTMAPLEVWGLVFLAVAVVQVAALISHRRFVYQSGLALMVGVMSVWAVVGLMAAMLEVGSYTAPLWPGFVVVACIASFRSLNAGER